MIIAADKNPNHYIMSAKDADKMLHNHITKGYKLAPENAAKVVISGRRLALCDIYYIFMSAAMITTFRFLKISVI